MQGHERKLIDNPLPVPELLARAEQGDTDCQYWAGLRYFQGEGVPEDPRKAIDYCALAAGQGDARALAFLAYCFSRAGPGPGSRYRGFHWESDPGDYIAQWLSDHPGFPGGRKRPSRTKN